MSVLPLEKDMFVAPVGSVFLFSFSQNCLHFCTRILPWRTNRTHMLTHMWLKIPRLCRPHKNKFITMSSMFALAHFSCSHSTPLTLTSSSSIPSSRTTSPVTLPIGGRCAAPPIEESGPLAITTSSTTGWCEWLSRCVHGYGIHNGGHTQEWIPSRTIAAVVACNIELQSTIRLMCAASRDNHVLLRHL